MKKISLIFLFLCLSFATVRAQFLDSIQASINRKGNFSFGFTSHNSFIDNSDAFIFGFQVGVCFDRRIAIGGGWNTLSPSLPRTYAIEGVPVKEYLNFSYFSYYVEYLFKLGRHWEIDIPVSIGFGSSSYSYTNSGALVTIDKGFVMPIEPSLEVDYDFNKYWGLYVQVGYRWMLVNNHAINADFNSPTYDFGILIYPLEIYAGLFPKTKLAHLIEDN